jgi:hypothetical protein
VSPTAVPPNAQAFAVTVEEAPGRHVRLAPLLLVFVPQPPDAVDPVSRRQVVSVAANAVAEAATPITPNTAALIALFLMDRTFFLFPARRTNSFRLQATRSGSKRHARNLFIVNTSAYRCPAAF